MILTSKALECLSSISLFLDSETIKTHGRSIKDWNESYVMLESDEGAAWKLIFKMLARGRLVDPETSKPLKISCGSLIRDNESLFSDTF